MNKKIEWKELLLPYEQVVQELKVKFKSIRSQYREMNEYSPIEFVTGRVKKISSIKEKAIKKEISFDMIEEFIDDIAGIRIMCQFVDDIYDVVELIRKRDGYDLSIMYEKDYIKHSKESGYKSYHIIIKYPVYTIFGKQNVLAEIQIRTLAMNFWATIEHSLNYKYKSKMPDELKERLKRAAVSATNLDTEMMSIKNEIIDAQLLFEIKSNLISEITSCIDKLYELNYKEKAEYYEQKLDEYFNEGNICDINKILNEIKEILD